MENILPNYAPRFYYGGDWFQMYDWVEASGGHLSNMVDRFYIIFSNKELKQDKKWNIYSITVSNFGKTIILNEMFEIDSMDTDPHITNIVSIYTNDKYLKRLDPDHTFFMSDVKNYHTLTARLLGIVNGLTTIKSIKYFL